MKKLLFIYLAEQGGENVSSLLQQVGLDRYIYTNKKLNTLYNGKLFLDLGTYKDNTLTGNFKKVYLYHLPAFQNINDIQTVKQNLITWAEEFKAQLLSIKKDEDFLFLNLEQLHEKKSWEAQGYKLSDTLINCIEPNPVDQVILKYLNLAYAVNVVDNELLGLLSEFKTKHSFKLSEEDLSKLLNNVAYLDHQSLKKDYQISKLEQGNKQLFVQYSQLQEKLENLLLQNTANTLKDSNVKKYQYENMALKRMNDMLLVQLNTIQENLENILRQKNNIKEQIRNKYNINFIENSNLTDAEIKNSVEYQLGKLIVDECKTFNGVVNVPLKMAHFIKEHDLSKKIIIESSSDENDDSSAKNHLSYKVGTTLIDCIHEPTKVIKLPLNLYKEITSFRLNKKLKTK